MSALCIIHFPSLLLSLSPTTPPNQSHNITSTLIKTPNCNKTIPTLFLNSHTPNGLIKHSKFKTKQSQNSFHAMDTKLLTIRTLVSALSSSSDQTRLAALRHLRRTSNEDPGARHLISAAGAVPLLAAALYSSSHSIQEHAAATLLNLSISDRRPLATSPALPAALSHLLSRHATSAAAAVQAAAATLHSLLAVVAEFRPVIGAKADILQALIDIISHPDSPTISIKDALKASFGVALHPPSRITFIRLGVIPVLFAIVAKGKDGKRRLGIIEDATAVIGQVAACEESEDAFRMVSGVSVLAMMLGSESGSCSLRTKENAVAALLNLVRYGSQRVFREVKDKVGGLDGIAYVQEHGSPKGKSKAVAFYKLLLDDGGSSGEVVQDLYPVNSESGSSCSG